MRGLMAWVLVFVAVSPLRAGDGSRASGSPPLPAGAVVVATNAVCLTVGPKDVIRWDGWRPGQQWQVKTDAVGKVPFLTSTNRVFAGQLFSKIQDGIYVVTVRPVRRDGSFGDQASLRVLWVDEEPVPVAGLRVEVN